MERKSHSKMHRYRERAALVSNNRIVAGRRRRIVVQLRSVSLCIVPRLPAQILRTRVVPPSLVIRRHAVDHRTTQPRYPEHPFNERDEVIRTQPGCEHPVVGRFRKARPNAHNRALDPELVVVQPRNRFAEALRCAIQAIRAMRRACVEPRFSIVEPVHMIRASKEDATDTFLSSGFVDVVETDNIGLKDLVEASLG